MPLSQEELLRYSRHVRLPQIGVAGQERLLRAKVLLLGLGGIGSPAALYLAAAGVGTLGVAEFDTVAAHNLQRQVLFREADVAAPKLDAGFATLRALNSQTRLVPHPAGLTPENAVPLFAGYDVVLDGTDNFAARYLANDAAHLARRPLVHASVFQFTAQLTVFDTAAAGPCLRCLFPEMPGADSVPTCEQAGVFGALCGAAGSLAAMEVVKLLTGAGEPLRGRMLLLDLLAGATRTVRVSHDAACPLCGTAPTIHEIDAANYAQDACACTAADGATNNFADGGEPLEIAVAEARARIANAVAEAAATDAANTATDANAAAAAPVVLDVREAFERATGSIPNSRHIPLAELGARLGELPADTEIFVVCQKGMRSLRGARLLREKGRLRARSIRGGIDAWARE
jgi:adenylyltransferase/sulfurtransferase